MARSGRLVSAARCRRGACPQIKGTATREIEAGVVPVAGQGAVLDAAAIQRKAHMRAAIVEREDTIFVVDDKYRSMWPVRPVAVSFDPPC